VRLRILYVEDARKGREALDLIIKKQHDVDFVTDLIALDEYLYDLDGYNKYDVLLIDLSIEMSDISIDELKQVIREFNYAAFKATELRAQIPLYAFDYFTHVVNTRPETKTMVKEGRVALISGQAESLKKSGKYTKVLFPDTPLISRGDKDADKMLEQVFTQAIKVRSNEL
jgi:hypothetical protein